MLLGRTKLSPNCGQNYKQIDYKPLRVQASFRNACFSTTPKQTTLSSQYFKTNLSSLSFHPQRSTLFKSFCTKSTQQPERKPTEWEQMIDQMESPTTFGKTCNGCGVGLQNTNPKMIGYVPPLQKMKRDTTPNNYKSKNDLLRFFDDEELQGLPKIDPEKEELMKAHQRMRAEQQFRNLICQRCFMLKHYREVIAVQVPIQQFRPKLTERLNNRRALVIKIIDIFDFSGSFIENFHEVVGPKNPVIVLANKMDLLPKGWTEERVRTWVKKNIEQLDPLLENVVGVHLISSKRNEGVERFLQTVDRYRKDRDIYVLGCSNSGKSTLINLLINQHRGFINPKVDIQMPTVSPVPGTTINFLAIPTKGGGFIYDTPGILNRYQLINYLTPQEVQLTLPSRPIKPANYFIMPGKSLFLGGVGRIDYVEGGGRMYFTVFASNRLPIHPTSTDRADLIYQKHLGTMLVPPIDFEKQEELKRQEQEREKEQQKFYRDHKNRGKSLPKEDEEEDDEERVAITEDSELSTTGTDTTFTQATKAERSDEEEFKEEAKRKNHLPEGQLPLMGIKMRKQGKFPPLVSKEWEFEGGKDWDRAFVDVVFPGLGWIAIAGPGKCKIRAWSIEGTGLFVREDPLMPFEHPTKERKGKKAIAHGKDHRNRANIRREERTEETERDHHESEDREQGSHFSQRPMKKFYK